MTAVAAVAGAALLAMSCSDEPTKTREGAGKLAPFYGVSNPERATDRYIVVLSDKTNVRETALRLAAANGGTIKHIFDRVLGGFSVTLPAQAVDVIRANPEVRSIRQVEEGAGRLDDHTYQTSAPWGLDRVDQRNLPLNATYGYSETGSGVRIYIIDSGIRTAHAQFGGRASVGFDARPEDGKNGQDCLGHGTHVAGIAGGQTYGIAKAATLISVRVTTACTVSVDPDDFIAGVNWVAGNHVKPAVANASIGFVPAIEEVDQALTDAVNLGIPFAVSGGNDGLDACNQSPARVPTAITVGATRSTDARWTLSNVGTCLDLFAPGENILSAWHTSNTATQTQSGTSMAAPHVTGTVAGFLQFRTSALPSEVAATIVLRATSGVLTSIGTGSPNLLLHSRFNDLSISGPSSMNCTDTYTWTAMASGVGSSFTYVWQQGHPTGFPGPGMIWLDVGTGPSYSRQGCPGDPYLWLRVTATDEFGFHRRVNKTVTVAP
jgi:subtilisin family serine protease